MREQIRLLREYGLKGTFLMQYDALLSEEFEGMSYGLEAKTGAFNGDF